VRVSVNPPFEVFFTAEFDINDIIDIVPRMATLLIRNLPDSLKDALKKRAADNGTSMEEEARQILHLELRRRRSQPREGLGTAIRRIFEESGAIGELIIPPRSDYPVTYKPLFEDEEPESGE
jgi:antitoxin FitA